KKAFVLKAFFISLLKFIFFHTFGTLIFFNIMENIKDYVYTHKDRCLSELVELLKIPSVSADSAYSQDVINTAEAVKKSLEKAGCDFVELCETPGYPIVYGEKIIDKNLPTVLVYGHYDVQPPDPIDLWDSP